MKEQATKRTPRARFGWLRLAVIVLAAGAIVPPATGGAAALSPPYVNVIGASGVTYSSVTLSSYINAHGQSTNYVFQYGTTSGYGAQTPLASAGNGTATIRVSQFVTGLQPATTYHYRLVAISSAGTTNARDHTFTTAKIPLSLQIVGVPNPVEFGSPFIIEGNLSGTGAASQEVSLQADPFPYVSGFKDVGNPEITNSLGDFSFPYIGLLENTQLRVVTVAKPEVVSPVVIESVAVRVSFHARSARRRGYVDLYGNVEPAEVGALVGFQLLRPGRSVNEGGTVVKAGTPSAARFSRIIRIRHPGLYRALVKVVDGAHVANYSEPILIR